MIRRTQVVADGSGSEPIINYLGEPQHASALEVAGERVATRAVEPEQQGKSPSVAN